GETAPAPAMAVPAERAMAQPTRSLRLPFATAALLGLVAIGAGGVWMAGRGAAPVAPVPPQPTPIEQGGTAAPTPAPPASPPKETTRRPAPTAGGICAKTTTAAGTDDYCVSSVLKTDAVNAFGYGP